MAGEKISHFARESAYQGIERAALESSKPQERPRAIVLGGQPGSGKSVLAAEAISELRARGGAILIDADRMREQNPEYKQLSRQDPQNAADRTHKEAATWATRLTVVGCAVSQFLANRSTPTQFHIASIRNWTSKRLYSRNNATVAGNIWLGQDLMQPVGEHFARI